MVLIDSITLFVDSQVSTMNERIELDSILFFQNTLFLFMFNVFQVH